MTSEDPITQLSRHIFKHAQPSTYLSYGTAGFRSHTDNLSEAMLRVGILAAIRSASHSGRSIGVMITASHNPHTDNGVKLTEPDGSMLAQSWEIPATQFVNATSDPFSHLLPLFDFSDLSHVPPSVILARDTRQSSPRFANLVQTGVQAAAGIVRDLGVVTTPQLHYIVRATRRKQPATLEAYYEDLKRSYGQLRGPVPVPGVLAVDCANGVGATAMQAVKALLPQMLLANLPEQGPLNAKCGADYVQKTRNMPTIYTSNINVPQVDIWASLDGDADRLVMFRNEADQIRLFDGDRFAALVASFVSKHIQRASLPELTVAVAQTAYSNGAATQFLQQLPRVDVVIAKTGVKHLEKAMRSFDIGIYWEPNGHGTVLFSDNAVAQLKAYRSKLVEDKASEEQRDSVDALLATSILANQAVGDGVADLLLALAILSREQMSMDDWLELYAERCSANMVVRVADKSVVQTEDCDRSVREPLALRQAIQSIAGAQGCRAFVRPSGTEDVVRVYAEAPVGKLGLCQEMATLIARAVYDHCAGVGERP